MRKFITLALCLFAVIGCETGIQYKIADHYFFRNDATIPESPIITTQEQFDSLFGMAPVMGGLPTEINFDKEFVLAIVLPETSCYTTINPKSLTSEGDKLILSYSLDIAPESTFTMVPCCILIVDKQYLKPMAQLKLVE